MAKANKKKPATKKKAAPKKAAKKAAPKKAAVKKAAVKKVAKKAALKKNPAPVTEPAPEVVAENPTEQPAPPAEESEAPATT